MNAPDVKTGGRGLVLLYLALAAALVALVFGILHVTTFATVADYLITTILGSFLLLLVLLLLAGRFIVCTVRGTRWMDWSWLRRNEKDVMLFCIILLGIIAFDLLVKLGLFKDVFYRLEGKKHRGVSDLLGMIPFLYPFYLAKIQIVIAVAVAWIFGVGGLFFRFNRPLLDRWWFFASALTAGSFLSVRIDRLLLGGVHELFYVKGDFWYILFLSGEKSMKYVFFSPSDLLFTLGVFVSLGVFIVSLLLPAGKK